MMSHSDIMIICSIFLAGKPLCMHISTVMVHLQMHQHPHWNPLFYESSKPRCLFFNPLSMPVTLSPRYFGAPSYQSLIYYIH